MALNIAVPMTTVGDLIDGFGLLSPISPLSVDCRGVATVGSHGKKQLVSPVGSESSGVSSLDSDEIKKPSSLPTTPTEEVERPMASSPLPPPSTADSDTLTAAPESIENKSSSCSSTRSSCSSTDSISSDCNSSEESQVEDSPELEPEIPKEVKVVIGGRNVLNLMDNLRSPGQFRLQFPQLPENNSIHFFLDNRSQYHRLGANGHIQEYAMVKCKCCDFRYPVNGPSPTNGGVTAATGQTNWATAVQQQHQTQLQQQQQQQQPFQWNGFNNNDSISSRNKLGLTVAASAFNKFGGGNNNNNNTTNNNNNTNGNQYFRNNMAPSLFGRDNNRSNSSGNFLNSSTNTYNNHKSYQQSFGTSNNNSKFNTPYGNYQVQQQLLSKNQHMRYGSGNGNGSGGFNASAAVAAASAMAGQNILNFNGNFSGKNNNNNNNMFAYYKAMMN